MMQPKLKAQILEFLKWSWTHSVRVFLCKFCNNILFHETIIPTRITCKKTPSKHLSLWRRLEDIFRLRLQKTSSRRLQDVFIKTNIFALFIRLQKTSWRRLEDVLVKANILVLVIRLQDVFKTSSRHLAKTSWKRLENVFKSSSRHLQDVFKTSLGIFKASSRRFQNVSSS